MNYFKISALLSLALGGALFFATPSLAYGELSNVTLKITPNTELSKATWVTSFTIPADTDVGHLLGSISGNPLDMSGASAVVSGLPEGYEIILKPRTTCASGCDDFRLWYQNPVKVAGGTRVTITINNVGNPGTSNTGWNYFDVFDSKYPTMHVAYSVTNKYVPLVGSAPACSADVWTCDSWSACSAAGSQSRSCTLTTDCPTASTPKPATSQSCSAPVATPACNADTWNCGDWSVCSPTGRQTRSCSKTYDCPSAETASPEVAQNCQTQSNTPAQEPNININIQQTAILSITQIQINNIFFFPGSHTTNLKKVNPTRVDNFSLDRQSIGYFTFLGRNDLSSKPAAETMSKLDDQVYFDYFYFRFEWKFWILFKTDLRCTFYDKDKLLAADTPVSVNSNILSKDEYKVEVGKDGAKNVTIKRDVVNKYVKEGESVEVMMRPTLNTNLGLGQTIISETNKFILSGSSSVKSKVFVNFNGEKIELAVGDKGAFEKTFTLEPGKNTIKVMAYAGNSAEPYASAENTIEYKEKKAVSTWQIILSVGIIGVLAGALKVWSLFGKKGVEAVK